MTKGAKKRPGPKPERLAIVGDWKTAVAKALMKKVPAKQAAKKK